jgi:hypothetical protein
MRKESSSWFSIKPKTPLGMPDGYSPNDFSWPVSVSWRGCLQYSVVGVAVLVLVAMIGVAYFDRYPPPNDERVVAAKDEVGHFLADHFRSTKQPRLEVESTNELIIYVTRSDFQAIPFPDRSPVIRDAGNLWCNKIRGIGLVPALYFRDIHTGEELAHHYCGVSVFSAQR